MARLPVLRRAPRGWRSPDVGPRSAGVVRPVHLRRRHRRRLRRGGTGDRLALPRQRLVLCLLPPLPVVHGRGVRQRGVPPLLLGHRARQRLMMRMRVAVMMVVVVGRAAVAGAAAGARGLPLCRGRRRRPRDHPRDRLHLLQARERLRVPPRVGGGRAGRRLRRPFVLRGRGGRGGFPGEVSLRLRRKELRCSEGGDCADHASSGEPLLLVVNHAHGGDAVDFISYAVSSPPRPP